MSDTFKRRRRRSGLTSGRSDRSRLIPFESIRRARIDKTGIAACVGVAMVAVALVALIWIVTTRVVQEQRIEIHDRAEQALAGQAATMAETISKELLVIDQSLTIIQSQWKADSDLVDLTKLQQIMPALTAVADDLFIANEKHIIQQDILPQAIGQGVGSAYVTFPHGLLEQYEPDGTKERASLLLQGDDGNAVEARKFLTYIVRPLDHPKGWLVGASYRSEEVTKLFAQSALGYNPVVALVDTRRGVVQAVVGPAARRPKIDLSKSPLFALLTRAPSGTWIGNTAIDGIERLHAFHRIGERDMAVLVGANWSDVMSPANNLAAGARSVAIAATVLVAAIAGLMLWGLFKIRGNRRRARVFDRSRSELERLRIEEVDLASRAKVNAARLQVVLDHTVDGIALFDSNVRLVQWNHPFRRGIGIEPKPNMPLDTLLREQAAQGVFGAIEDLEAEIARRDGILRTGDMTGVPQPGPDQETLVLRGMPIAEGGFMLLLNGLLIWETAPAPVASTEVDEPVVAKPVVPAALEW